MGRETIQKGACGPVISMLMSVMTERQIAGDARMGVDMQVESPPPPIRHTVGGILVVTIPAETYDRLISASASSEPARSADGRFICGLCLGSGRGIVTYTVSHGVSNGVTFP